MFENKTIIITGATGSWGQEATKKLLLQNPKEIRCYARNEFNLVSMQRKFDNPKLKFIIGDVRDYDQLNRSFQSVDYVLHFAALKQVHWAEEYPEEFIKTNINGTENVIRAALNNGIKRLVDASTDKACEPAGTYGASKMIAERMVLRANYNSNTEFQCIRGGNVMGSQGSLIPLLISQIKENNKVTITDERMTRYFITLSQAIDLVFLAMESSVLNATYILNMKSCKIIDLVRVMIEHYGNEDTKIETMGIRLGEKLHEVLISKTEALNSYIYNNDYFLIFPFGNSTIKLPRVSFEEYNSSTKLMGKSEIKAMLHEGGFLV